MSTIFYSWKEKNMTEKEKKIHRCKSIPNMISHLIYIIEATSNRNCWIDSSVKFESWIQLFKFINWSLQLSTIQLFQLKTSTFNYSTIQVYQLKFSIHPADICSETWDDSKSGWDQGGTNWFQLREIIEITLIR
jgi:hypothetical protein